MTAVHDLLVKSWALIDTPEKWCQGDFVEFAADGTACRCALGALIAVRVDLPAPAPRDTYELLAKLDDSLLSECYAVLVEQQETRGRWDEDHDRLSIFNDSCDHAELERAWASAIEATA